MLESHPLPPPPVERSGRVARALLGLHLASGPLLGLAGTGAVVAGLFAGHTLPLGTFLLIAIPALALGALPSNTAMLACGALYGWRGGAAFLPGLVASSLPAFWLVRRTFRSEARELLERHPKARRVVLRLEEQPRAVALLVRIAPVSTFAWTNALLSVSRLRLRDYLATTATGIAVRLALLTWAGASAGNLARALREGTAGPAAAATGLLSLAGLGLLGLQAGRILSKPASAEECPSSLP